MKDAQKLIIIVPCLDHIVPQVDAALRQVEQMGVRVHRAFGQSAIDSSRCRLATQALAKGYEEILWIDSDVGFDPADVQRLRDHGLALVGGVYAKKAEPTLTCIHLPVTQAILFEPGAAPVDVLYLPGGFLYTRAEVYRAIQRRCELPTCNRAFEPSGLVPYFMPMIVQHQDQPVYLGEDYAFCHRARHAGFRVMADPGIRLTHYGRYGWTLEDCIHAKPTLPRLRLSFKQPSTGTSPTNAPRAGD